MNRTARWTVSLGIAVCCLAASACSKGKVERLDLSNATLEGTVTLNGKPVPRALIVVAGERASSTATAENDGKYKAEHVPVGQVQIGVNTDAARGAMMGEMMASKKGAGKTPEFVGVAKKYFDPKTSGITTTISDGANTFDIKL